MSSAVDRWKRSAIFLCLRRLRYRIVNAIEAYNKGLDFNEGCFFD